jgi:hypothetical protein
VKIGEERFGKARGERAAAYDEFIRRKNNIIIKN